jgi:transcription elongation factor/antiterminator RfaH
MNGLGWYVVQSQPRKETLVRDRLEEMGREVFLPMLRERRQGRRRTTTGPLFPGYLFARLSETHGDLPVVRWTHGVRRVLGDGERPTPVGDGVIELIRSRTGSSGSWKTDARLRRGDRVRILQGPLAGLIGVLERPAASAEERVTVLLSLFQRWTRVEIQARAVWGLAGLNSGADEAITGPLQSSN